MDKNSAISELRALASGDQRPAAARLRDLFEEIEAAIGAGVRRADIRNTLARHGLDMPFASFVRTLARIRKERGLVAPTASPTRPEASPAVSQPTSAPVPDAAHNPASSPAAETKSSAATISPTPRVRSPFSPVGARLPDDWLTADLTREQKRLLTAEQRSARADAVVREFCPNPFEPVPPQKEDPASSGALNTSR